MITQKFIKIGDLSFEPLGVSLDPRFDRLGRLSKPVEFGGSHDDQLGATIDKSPQFQGFLVGKRASIGSNRLGEMRENASINCIGLRVLTD